MGKILFNPKVRNRIGVLLLVMADALALLAFFYFSAFLRSEFIPLLPYKTPAPHVNLGIYYWIIPLWIMVIVFEGGYTKRFTYWDEVRFCWKSTFFVSITLFTILFIGKIGESFSRTLLLTMSLSAIILFPVIRTNMKRLLYSFDLLKRKIIILGTGKEARASLAIFRNERNLGYDVAGFIDEKHHGPGFIEGLKIHGFLDKADRYIRRCSIHDVLIASPLLKKERLVKLINKIQQKAENTLYLSDLTGIAVLGTELRHFFKEQSLVIEIKNNLSRPANYIVKRTFDFTLGLVLFFLLLPPIGIIALVIRTTSPGPAIFRQKRIGRARRVFECLKFRTMYLDAEVRLNEILDSGPEARGEWEKYRKLRNDPRITPFGRLLRMTSLDELPQIFNVIKGEMSLVGPRPYLLSEWNEMRQYGEIILNVPPGITGLWQVSGRSNKTFKERLSLESWYVRNWNLWLDIVIMLKTVYTVFRREGAC